MANAATDTGADAIVGVGGGKAIDTAKAVAHPAELPLVIVPTIASTDAPTSSLSVIYDDDGAFLEYRFWGRTRTSCWSTPRSSRRRRCASSWPGSATAFRRSSRPTRPRRRAKSAMAGGPPLLAAKTLARLCYDTLLADGLAARHAAERGVSRRRSIA